MFWGRRRFVATPAQGDRHRCICPHTVKCSRAGGRCAAGGALAANGIPAGLTPLTPVAATPAQPGRRGGRGQSAHAAPAERGPSGAEPAADNGEAKCVSHGYIRVACGCPCICVAFLLPYCSTRNSKWQMQHRRGERLAMMCSSSHSHPPARGSCVLSSAELLNAYFCGTGWFGPAAVPLAAVRMQHGVLPPAAAALHREQEILALLSWTPSVLCTDKEVRLWPVPRRQAAPGTVLWVGGMERGTSEAAIRAAFAEWGVEAVRLPDGADAATKGFAFLTFPTPEKAQA